MNFLFVDRILEMERGKYIRGIKYITSSDPYLYCPAPEIEPDKWALLDSLIGETLGQLGAWCVIDACDYQMRPVAGVVSAVHAYDNAFVGQCLELETFIDSWDKQAVEYHGVARINNKIVYEIERALGPMLPMTDFNQAEQVKQQFDMIYRPGEVDTLNRSLTPQLTTNSNLNDAASFDRIIDWRHGERIVAQKQVSLMAPYFVDHFPKKPVLPLTILLNCKIEMVRKLLQDLLSLEQLKQFNICSFRKIKMNAFVQPGETVVSTIELHQHNQDNISFLLRSEVNKKRVCVAQVEFRKTTVNSS